MKIALVMLLTGLFCSSANAQLTVSTTGSEASGAGGTVSYTAGKVVYTTITGTNGSLDLGVQQPYEISVITSLYEAIDIGLQWNVYPNPTHDFLTLSLPNPVNSYLKVKDLSYQIFDINGKIVQYGLFDGDETTIQMGTFRLGTYFLKVIQTLGAGYHKEIKIFKIIKY
jgi:hypothetical protein